MKTNSFQFQGIEKNCTKKMLKKLCWEKKKIILIFLMFLM